MKKVDHEHVEDGGTPERIEVGMAPLVSSSVQSRANRSTTSGRS